METFVVRVFTPAVPEPSMREGVLSGVVEHVASGGRMAFSDSAQLIAFLTDRAHPMAQQVNPGGGDRPAEERSR